LKKHLFIIGLHRSGTTLLSDVIGENSCVTSFQNTGVPMNEGQFLQSVFFPDSYVGGPGKFAFNKRSYLNETSKLITPENKITLDYQWSLYWDATKAIRMEKSPSNIIKTRFLQEIFPNSYFLLIMRHPLATSYATKKWSRTSLVSLMRHWKIAHNAIEQDKVYLENFFSVKYEQLVSSPETTMKLISDFVKENLTTSSKLKFRNENVRYADMWREENPLIRKFILEYFRSDSLKFDYDLDSF
jgi:hypothetical protein